MKFESSGEMRAMNNQSWSASPSKVASHFGTSGVAVAAATSITHPLGFLFQYLIRYIVAHVVFHLSLSIEFHCFFLPVWIRYRLTKF